MTQQEFCLAALTDADLKSEFRRVNAPGYSQKFLRSVICYVLMNARDVIGEDGVLLVNVAITKLAELIGCHKRTIRRGVNDCRDRGWVLSDDAPTNQPRDYTIYLRRFCPEDVVEWIEWSLENPDRPWKPSPVDRASPATVPPTVASCPPDSSNCPPDSQGDCPPDSWGDTTCNMFQDKQVHVGSEDEAKAAPDGREQLRVQIEQQLAGQRQVALEKAYDELFGHPKPWECLKQGFGNDLIRMDDAHVFELMFSSAVDAFHLPGDRRAFLRFLAFCHNVANSDRVRNPYGLIVGQCEKYKRGDHGAFRFSKADEQWAADAFQELARAGKGVFVA